VVPPEQLDAFTLSMAQKIASKPQFAVKMTKEAVNRTLDIMGQSNAINMVTGLHQLCHAHNELLFGMGGDPSGIHASVARHPDSYWKKKADA
jgi:enoyl-CoA hydratase